MYNLRLCRYRGAFDNVLTVARFSTVHSANMDKNSSLPPRLPQYLFRSQPHDSRSQCIETRERDGKLLPGASTASTPLLYNEEATIQSVQDIAQSMERVSIVKDSSPISSLQPRRITETLQQAFRVKHPDAPPIDYAPSVGPKPKRSKNRQENGRDEKILPSEGSGGVPNVTQEYLEASNVIPRFLGTPQNILVVIDLNGTLLFRPSRTAPKKFLTRPHAKLFLKYCVETFTVVIWSSARPENVKAMCDSILTPTLRSKVAAIWGRDKFNLTQQDYNLRVQCYKRLQKVWGDERIAVSHPAYNSGGRWNQTNTVLIDDSIEKARSEPHNLIEVPEWFGNLDEADDILPQVHDHLNYLSLHSNVSACLRTNPFKPSTGGTQTLQ
jgi:hypothetical protein